MLDNSLELPLLSLAAKKIIVTLSPKKAVTVLLESVRTNGFSKENNKMIIEYSLLGLSGYERPSQSFLNSSKMN